ncbi:hypothetical protein GCM10010390_10350 [Streptomyces mordarskii]|uniref:Uncharacterized protein n=1 Tax=Streptomyces mordarskii TaxID=1226758 RepID=A0ABP3M1U2_9ACTN
MPARITRARNLSHSSGARDAPFLCSRARERAQGARMSGAGGRNSTFCPGREGAVAAAGEGP